MTRRDRGIVAALILVLAVLGVALAIPGVPVEPVAAEPTPDASLPPAVVYREGVVGIPQSITPVTARSRAERTLVGLVFSGLVKLGPGSTYLPDLAQSWTTSDDGRTWTFRIREDAIWQDGEPVTADDVVYTVEALKSPDTASVAAGSWADVTAEAVDEHTVTFKLDVPVAGFLAAATQPLLPAHVLADVPFSALATSEFAQLPVGSGPFAISEIDGDHALLVPSSTVLPGTEEPAGSSPPPGTSPTPTGQASSPPPPDQASSPPPPDQAAPSPGSAAPSASVVPLPTPQPTPSESAEAPNFDQVDIRFFADEKALTTAMEAGQIDAAAGLSTAATSAIAARPGVERVRYPTTTLSTVLLNLRPSHMELRDPKVRQALLAAIDRDTLAADVLGGDASRADSLVPPGSWAFDAASAGTVPYDTKAAAKLLANAGWTKKKGKLYAPKAKQPYKLELLTVPAAANPRLAAEAGYARDAWAKLGMDVEVVEVEVADLATRLREGDYTAAVLDIAEGLEPDLYPLLASSQVRAAGSNLSGYQDASLDKLLEAARTPGTTEVRVAAWKALLAGLAKRQPLLPLVWIDEVMVARGLEGPRPRLIAHPGDRYWDVLAWRLAASR